MEYREVWREKCPKCGMEGMWQPRWNDAVVGVRGTTRETATKYTIADEYVQWTCRCGWSEKTGVYARPRAS